MDLTKLRSGDWVIYRKQKISKSPGQRAIEVRPAASGEMYQYMVDKFWVVDEVTADGQVRLHTRRGKHHVVPADDTRLRKPRWWERWLYRKRFEAIGMCEDLVTKPANPSAVDPSAMDGESSLETSSLETPSGHQNTAK